MKTIQKVDTFNSDVYHFFNDSRITTLAGLCSDPYYTQLYKTCANHHFEQFTPLLYLAYTHYIYRYDDLGARFLRVHLNDDYLVRIEAEFYIQKVTADLDSVRAKRTDGRQLVTNGLYIGCEQASGLIHPYYFKFSNNPTEEFTNLLLTFADEVPEDLNSKGRKYLGEYKVNMKKYVKAIECVAMCTNDADKFKMATAEAEHYLPYISKATTEDIDE